MTEFILILASLISSEVALHLPFKKIISSLVTSLRKSRLTLGSKYVSDVRKEKVLPVYSVQIFKNSLLLLIFIVLFCIPIIGAAWFVEQSFENGFILLGRNSSLMLITVSSVIYIIFRIRYTHARLF